MGLLRQREILFIVIDVFRCMDIHLRMIFIVVKWFALYYSHLSNSIDKVSKENNILNFLKDQFSMLLNTCKCDTTINIIIVSKLDTV